MRWINEFKRPYTVRSNFLQVSKARVLSVVLIFILFILPVLSQFDGSSYNEYQLNKRIGYDLHLSEYSILVNEVYPEPGHDTNNDGTVDTLDEFIEIFNPTGNSIDIINWTISDNYGDHTISQGVIASHGSLVLWRNETSLRLGRDDNVILRNENGSMIDEVNWTGFQNGFSLQRAPNGNGTWRKVFHPTPGSPNLGPPGVKINEVMIDPKGSNLGAQWIELVNKGQTEYLKGFSLSNGEGVGVEFDDGSLGIGDRILILLGDQTDQLQVPEDVLVLYEPQDNAMFVNGDDLFLLDPDDRVVDYIAWGSSMHVEGPGSGYGGIEWSGKLWDSANGTMSQTGLDNPIVIEGRTLSRSPDGWDSSSPEDLGQPVGNLHHTMGWSNDLDPSVDLDLENGPLIVEKGSFYNLTIKLSNTGNMIGDLNISLAYNSSWSIIESTNGEHWLDGQTELELYINVSSPSQILPDRYLDITIITFWQYLDFLKTETNVQFVIPAPDVSIEDVSVDNDPSGSTFIPSGNIAVVDGKVMGGGEKDPGDVDLELRLFPFDGNENEPTVLLTRSFTGLTRWSRRGFEFQIDTLDLEGDFNIVLHLDRKDLMDELDEDNNIWSGILKIIPTEIPEGQMGIRITEVLWNCSIDEAFITIENPTDSSVDISGMRLTDGVNYISFPDEIILVRSGRSTVVWGSKALDRIGNGSQVFSISSQNGIPKMDVSGPVPDPFSSESISLTSTYRAEIDSVYLKRSMEGDHGNGTGQSIETTWGTVLFRSRNGNGSLIDTNNSKDWMVITSKCSLENFLPEPAPGGSGEFVSVKTMNGNMDLSGYLVYCSGRGVVIPNGTRTDSNGYLVISKDPGEFIRIQERVPEVTTGYDMKIEGMPIVGGRVPTLQELILPNLGSTLYLLDPGNRIVGSVMWGGHNEMSIGKPGRDTILGISHHNDEMRISWTGVGVGSAWSGLWNEGSAGLPATGILFNSDLAGLRWVLEKNRTTVITTSIEDEKTLSELKNFIEKGGELEVIYTIEPWASLSGIDEKMHPALKRAGHAKFLMKNGARIRTIGSDLGTNGPSLIYGEGRLLYLPRGLHSPLTKQGGKGSTSIGIDLSLQSVKDDIEGLIDRYRDISSKDLDPLEFVDTLEPMLEFSNNNENGQKYPMEDIAVRIGSYLSQAPVCGSGSSLDLRWSSGPFDPAYLIEYGRGDQGVRMILDPAFMEMAGQNDGLVLSRFLEGMERGDRSLSFAEMETDVLFRTAALLRYSIDERLNVDVRVADVEHGSRFDGSEFHFQDTSRLWLPRTDRSVPPVSLVLEGASSKFTTGPFDIIWENGFPFPWGLIGEGKLTEKDRYDDLRIQEVYYDTYLPDDPDEYVSIMNHGSSEMNLSGLYITDDEGIGFSTDGIIMLGDITLGPGETIFITRSGEDFISQNGNLSFIDWFNRDGSRAISCAGDLRLANSNDTLTIRDRSGYVIDSVTWGSADLPQHLWPCYPTGQWFGDPCPDIGWGRVLTRHLDVDTNSRFDWSSIRPRFPGQSRFDMFGTEDIESLVVGVCPGSGSEVMDETLVKARSEVLINVYELTSIWITSRLIGLQSRGVRVKVLLEGNPVGGIGLMEQQCIQKLLVAGVDVRLMVTDPSNNIRDRYRYDHAKYAIVDGEHLLISSDNFKDSSFPPLGERTNYGTRGWVVSGTSMEIAGDLKEVFISDWRGPDIMEPKIDEDIGNWQDIAITKQASDIIPQFQWEKALHTVNGGSGCLLVSPDHISLESNTVLSSILDAQEEILVELMDLKIDYLSNSVKIDAIPSSHDMDMKNYGVDVFNPYLKALLTAASNGVEVKILLDGSDFNGDGLPDNSYEVQKLNDISRNEGVEDNFHVYLHPSPRFTLEDEISMVHNKGMIIDRELAWISSFNWGPASGLENREVGILIRSPEAAEYFRNCLLFDMGGYLQEHITAKKEWIKGEFDGDDLRSVEVGTSIAWRGEGPLVLQLVHIRNEGTVSAEGTLDSTNIPGSFDGRVILNSGYNERLNDGILILRIRQGEIYYDISIIEVYAQEERTGSDGISWYQEDWVPFMLIILVAVGISMIKALISKKRHHDEE